MRTTINPWVVLGIEPCGDLRRIKKAYAEKLKQTNPEVDPEGFMELREAYEYLRALVTGSEESNRAATTYEPDPTPVPKRPVRESPSPLVPNWDVPRAVQRLMNRAWTICQDDALRSSVEAWRSVIDDDALWWVDVRLELSRRLYELVTAVDPSGAVWLLLDEEFRWRERGLSLEHDFERDAFAPVETRGEHTRPSRVREREWLTYESAFAHRPLLSPWLEHHLLWLAAAVTALTYWLT